ncbi:MAG: hypothetical protein ACRD3G_06760 [Vicinamibacterales bacterium]
MKTDLYTSRVITTGAVSTFLMTLVMFVARVTSLAATDCFIDGYTWVAQDCQQDPSCAACALSVCDQFAAGDSECELSCQNGAYVAGCS